MASPARRPREVHSFATVRRLDETGTQSLDAITATEPALAPGAFHRLAFRGEDVPLVHKVGSILVTSALAALALGLSADVMVALGALSGRLDVGALIAAIVLLTLFGLWCVSTLLIRAHLRLSGRRR
jgi:hypothetical protein